MKKCNTLVYREHIIRRTRRHMKYTKTDSKHTVSFYLQK